MYVMFAGFIFIN